MSDAPSTPASLRDLTALNDEIAAMVRAGIPLDRGLKWLATSSRGRLARLAEGVQDRLERGESIESALSPLAGPLEAPYRAVLEAGLRSGRLSQGVEAFARFGRSVLEFRSSLALAVAYPLVVVALAYAFAVWFVTTLVPLWLETYREFGVAGSVWFHFGGWLAEHVEVWIAIGPAVLVALVLWGWTSRRGAGLGPFRWLPGTGWVLRNVRTANFCDLLGLLVEQRVPLPEALRLAAVSTGDARLGDEAAETSRRVADGEDFAELVRRPSPLPPFVRWMLASGHREGRLAVAARGAANVCRRRATYRASLLQIVVPVALTIFVGGGAVFVYAMMLWWPMLELLKSLSLA